MSLSEILAAFAHVGLSDIDVIADDPDHVNGPAFTFIARRPAGSATAMG